MGRNFPTPHTTTGDRPDFKPDLLDSITYIGCLKKRKRNKYGVSKLTFVEEWCNTTIKYFEA